MRGVDNREALAYLLFRRFGCSRVQALEAVDEMGDMVPAIKKVAAKRWRSRRRTTPNPKAVPNAR